MSHVIPTFFQNRTTQLGQNYINNIQLTMSYKIMVVNCLIFLNCHFLGNMDAFFCCKLLLSIIQNYRET